MEKLNYLKFFLQPRKTVITIKNGALMTKAIENNFDIFLTIDKNIEYQQNLKSYQIAVVVLITASSKIEDLEKLLPNFKQNINTFEKGKVFINN
jgi:hypothetical protein